MNKKMESINADNQNADNMCDEYIKNSILWAKAHLGSTEYKLKCLAFIEDALERSNNIEIFGGSSAKESSQIYKAEKNKSIPPKGAFVFYDCKGPVSGEIKDWGHCGLALENGDVIHVWDRIRIDNYLDIQNLVPSAGWNQPEYIGWVPIEQILIGHIKKEY